MRSEVSEVRHTTEENTPENLSYGLIRIWDEGSKLPELTPRARALHQIQQGWRGVVTTPLTTIVTVLTIAMALFMLAGFILLLENLAAGLARTHTDLRLSMFIQDGVEQIELEPIISGISALSGVQGVAYVGKEKALEQFRITLGDQSTLLEGLDENNPLPAAIEVTLSDKESANAIFEQIVQEYEGDSRIEFIQYSRGLINQLSLLLKRLRVGGALAILLTLCMTGFIISNTIQLALYARRQEIEIMHLVGATENFIRAPFMIEGFLQGFAGSVLGLSILYLAYAGAQELLLRMDLFQLIGPEFLFLSWTSSLLVICVGLAVGIGGSYVAVRRFRERL